MNNRLANLHIIWMIARKDLVDAVKNQLLVPEPVDAHFPVAHLPPGVS